jgi:quinol-cytochrome oxidoreductase complex cytochrome b subunit
MVTVASLWLPILLSAVLVFLASSLIHMMLPYHRSDFSQVPAEESARDALRPVPPGDYVIPWGAGPAAMKDPVWLEKVATGPVVYMTVRPKGPFNMNAPLVQWFLYCVLVSVFAGYVAGRALGPGATYLEVFRFAGTTAFAGYGLAQIQMSIWGGRKWSTTIKNLFDSLIYALLTAGTFGWRWPA